MEHQDEAADEGEHEAPETAAYDVLLGSPPPEWVQDWFTTSSISSTRPQTALRRRLDEPRQLDALLQKLVSVGMRLVEVHLVRGSATPAGEVYEVRVDGEVGEPLLQYLSWPHELVPCQTRVRVQAAPAELHQFLLACTQSGARIQRVHAVSTSSGGRAGR